MGVSTKIKTSNTAATTYLHAIDVTVEPLEPATGKKKERRTKEEEEEEDDDEEEEEEWGHRMKIDTAHTRTHKHNE